MQVTIDIPDWLAEKYAETGKELTQGVLEAVAVDGYRTGKFGDGGMEQILGYGTPMQAHELLKEYDVYLNYSLEQLHADIETADRLAAEAQAKPVAA